MGAWVRAFFERVTYNGRTAGRDPPATAGGRPNRVLHNRSAGRGGPDLPAAVFCTLLNSLLTIALCPDP